MRYKAKVWRTRNGCRCKLYIWVFFFWFPIDSVNWVQTTIPDSVSFLITEKLDVWKNYYGDKLTIIDPRPDKQKGFIKQ